ncbi:MAG: hypothetical protein NDF52_03585 [archaeon YNP-WB-062]|jgi:hypothetical protein|nr:hypothetical protein [Candidatus Culexarchaeum yellowstonense]
MLDFPLNVGCVNLVDLLSGDGKLVLGSFGILRVRVRVNYSVIDCADWERTLIVDSVGLYKYLCNVFEDAKLLKLGFNASINPFKFDSEDPYLEAKMVSDIFRLSFHLGEDSARVLLDSLISLISKGVLDFSVSDVISEVESQSLISRSYPYVHRLLRLLGLMSVGRVGSSFNSMHGFSNLNSSLIIVDVSHLPVEFRVLSSLLILMKFRRGFDFILVENAGIIAPEMSRALREEYAVSFERSMIFYDLIHANESKYILLSCDNPLWLNSKIRSVIDVAFAPIPRYRDALDSLLRTFSSGFYDSNALKSIDIDDDVYFMVFKGGDVKLANYSGRLEFKGEFEVADELKPLKPSQLNILVKLFGSKADLAYGILSFLSQGIVERDLVIGYITGVYGLSATEAKKILTTLSVNGLIVEGVHRDGKYYLKLSPMGVAVMNEYSELGGG